MMKLIFGILLLYFSASKLLRLPVNGSLKDSYSLTLHFGSQKTPAKVLIDTGSSLTVLQCINCIKCLGKGNNNLYSFEESLSSTRIGCQSREPICQDKCRSNQQFCQYKISYAQGSSVYGDIIKDRVFLSNETTDQFRAFFGCIDYQNNVHNEEINILGLSPVARQNIIYPFLQSKPSFQYQYSTCFGNTDGYMQIGVNPNYSSITPEWTSKFYSSQSVYRIHQFQSLKFGSLTVTPSNLKGGIILDTGTTYILFPQEMYNKISEQIYSRCERLKSTCVSFPQDPKRIIIVVPAAKSDEAFNKDLDKNFQKFAIKIGQAKTQIKPSQYFVILQQQQDQVFLMAGVSYITNNANTGAGNEFNKLIILGMSWLRNKKIVFNLKEQTIKAYYYQNCTYTPAPREKDQSLIGVIVDAWEYIKTVPIEYLIISLTVLVAIAIAVQKNLDAIKKKFTNLKNCITQACKRTKKPKKQNRSSIQLNKESFRDEQGIQKQRQKPTVPKSMKKRGRNRSVKKKKPTN